MPDLHRPRTAPEIDRGGFAFRGRWAWGSTGEVGAVNAYICWIAGRRAVCCRAHENHVVAARVSYEEAKRVMEEHEGCEEGR